MTILIILVEVNVLESPLIHDLLVSPPKLVIVLVLVITLEKLLAISWSRAFTYFLVLLPKQ